MATQDEHPPGQSAQTALIYWALQGVGWSAYFYIQASGEVVFADASWRDASMMWGGVCLSGVALTHMLRSTAKHRAWFALPPSAWLPRILAGALFIGLASGLITTTLALTLYGTPVAPLFGAFWGELALGGQLRNQFVSGLAMNGFWVAIYLSVTLQRRRYRTELRQAKLAEALREAELRLLQAQLNPHFLFNAINSVRALIAAEPQRAQDALTQLANTLRYALSSDSEDLVSLRRELEMVDDYLALESLRLAERLVVEREIQSAALATRVPIMLMQTLVENAIKHGIAPLQQGGALRIAAHLAGHELVIEVSNTHQAKAPHDASAEGIGLKNLAKRLRLLFGPAGQLQLDLSRPGQAVANVRLPA